MIDRSWFRAGRIWIALAACVLAAGFATPGLAEDSDDDGVRVREKSKVKIVRVDENGDAKTETYEWDQDHPRAFLGVVTEDEDGRGARVSQVLDDTAAERAGIEEGDVIVSFDGETIDEPGELFGRIMEHEPGDSVDIEVLRDGDSRTLRAELDERKHRALALGRLGEVHGLEHLDMPGFHRFSLFGGRPRLGVELVEATPELREHFGAPADAGVIVGRLLDGMPAEGAGVRVGDIIVAVDGKDIGSAGDLIEALDDAEGTTIELELIRDGRPQRVRVEIPGEDADDVPTGPRA